MGLYVRQVSFGYCLFNTLEYVTWKKMSQFFFFFFEKDLE